MLMCPKNIAKKGRKPGYDGQEEGWQTRRPAKLRGTTARHTATLLENRTRDNGLKFANWQAVFAIESKL
jgi:hypothetical protein